VQRSPVPQRGVQLGSDRFDRVGGGPVLGGRTAITTRRTTVAPGLDPSPGSGVTVTPGLPAIRRRCRPADPGLVPRTGGNGGPGGRLISSSTHIPGRSSILTHLSVTITTISRPVPRLCGDVPPRGGVITLIGHPVTPVSSAAPGEDDARSGMVHARPTTHGLRISTCHHGRPEHLVGPHGQPDDHPTKLREQLPQLSIGMRRLSIARVALLIGTTASTTTLAHSATETLGARRQIIIRGSHHPDTPRHHRAATPPKVPPSLANRSPRSAGDQPSGPDAPPNSKPPAQPPDRGEARVMVTTGRVCSHAAACMNMR
jgi:hypothetical protein